MPLLLAQDHQAIPLMLLPSSPSVISTASAHLMERPLHQDDSKRKPSWMLLLHILMSMISSNAHSQTEICRLGGFLFDLPCDSGQCFQLESFAWSIQHPWNPGGTTAPGIICEHFPHHVHARWRCPCHSSLSRLSWSNR